MKAVIMAAGESTRTYPLTVDTPKPLLKIANKEIIKHNMENLAGLVDGFVVIVGFKKEMIKKALGSEFMGKKITYVGQKERLGTGHALLQAEKQANGKIMVLNGDDLYSEKDMKKCMKHENCVLAKEVPDPEKFGVFVLKDDNVTNVIEKSANPPSRLANTGRHLLVS